MTNIQKPAYKNPWFWLVMAPLISAFISGFTMLYLASKDFDGLVSDNYVKDGFAIHAPSYSQNLTAQLHIIEGGKQVNITLTPQEPANFKYTEAINLRFVHPTRADKDFSLILQRDDKNVYTGSMQDIHQTLNTHTAYEVEAAPLITRSSTQDVETDTKAWKLKALLSKIRHDTNTLTLK